MDLSQNMLGPPLHSGLFKYCIMVNLPVVFNLLYHNVAWDNNNGGGGGLKISKFIGGIFTGWFDCCRSLRFNKIRRWNFFSSVSISSYIFFMDSLATVWSAKAASTSVFFEFISFNLVSWLRLEGPVVLSEQSYSLASTL